MSNKTYTITNERDFEALKSLPRPSTFTLTIEGDEGRLVTSALLSSTGEVWVHFPHEETTLYKIPSWGDLTSQDLESCEINLFTLSALFGHS